MLSVEITNFKSLKHIKFEFDGFATIVGRNFIGKSNTIQAINAALTNQSGSDFITWGEKFCEVRLVTKGLDLLWHKEKGNNFYEINGQSYKKIGREEVPKVLKDLGYGVVKLDSDTKINLMYARQFDEMFLVDKKDTKTLDLLTAVYGLDRLYKSIELCNKDQLSNSGLLRIRKKDIEVLEKDLERFKDFEKVLERRDLLKIERDGLEGLENKIEELKALFADLVTTHTAVKNLKRVESVALPEIKEIAPKIEHIKEIKTLSHLWESLTQQTEALKKVENVSIPVGLDFIKVFQGEITSLVDLQNAYAKATLSFQALEKVPEIKVPAVPSIDIGAVSVLEEIYESAINIKRELRVIAEGLEERDKGIEQLQRIIKKEFKGMCPLCGNSLGKNHGNH